MQRKNFNKNTAISVKNVSKQFVIPHEKRQTVRDYIFNFWKKNEKEVFHALSDISFEVKEGEFFGIIGRNGSGKSTLLKIIARIYESTKGKVEVRGKISPFLELGVGFNPELSARENVYLNGTILGLSGKQIENKFDEIIRFAELEQFIDQKLKNFSSGMQVRLAFSVAIQADADILLLDEVLAVGDANFQQKCFDVFRKFKKEGKTIVFVSHDIGSIRQFCNRALYLKDSKIEMIGDPNEVVDHYIYEDKKDEEVKEKVSDEKIKKEIKPIEITKVEFIDKFGNKNKTYLSGDKFTIRIHYKKNMKVVEDPVLGIAVYRDDGTHIYGTNTDLQKIDLNLKTKGVVELVCNNLPLIQGKFVTTLAFHRKDGVVYDWHDREYEFYVQKGGNKDGLVELDFTYKIQT